MGTRLARSGNPAIGLTGAVQAKPRHFGIIAYALMSAPDLLGILHRVARYVGIVSDAAIVTVRRHGDAHRLVLTVRPGSRPAPHQRFAFDLLRFLSFCRWVTDTELKPTAVRVGKRPLPSQRRLVACRGSVLRRTRSYSRTPMPPGRYPQQTIGCRQSMIGS
jgi:hypothetical protein